MVNKFANQSEEIEYLDLDFSVDEMEKILSEQLNDSLSELKFLEKDRKNIGNPDSLGKIVGDEIWKQFANQIGLDMTNETLIQKYNREHPETYKEVADKVMRDTTYKSANNEMKEQQQSGVLIDKYTGKKLERTDKANLDHVVSRKKIFENARRKQANLSTEQLANKSENLRATNESLNKSKGAKSNEEFISYIEKDKDKIIARDEKKKEKIDNDPNKYAVDKKHEKEIIDKRTEDKLAADKELMLKEQKNAEKAINKDIIVGATKQTTKKAGKDALKMMAVQALSVLLKEIMNGFVRFLKSKAKSFNTFLEEMKQGIRRFLKKIMDVLRTGTSSFVSTIISEIFGPIVSVFKKLSSIIKQGVSSIMEAVRYLKDEKNKNKPFATKIAQVGKIAISGLVAAGAIFGGEVFEKILMTVPGMQIKIPLIGTLANMIGLFLSSLISGLIGAIIINMIDKFLAKKAAENASIQIIDKQNAVLNTQEVQSVFVERQFDKKKKNSFNDIEKNHEYAKHVMEESLGNIFEQYNQKTTYLVSENQSDLDRIQKELDDLL